MITIVRHGESFDNVNRVLCGQRNPRLTRKGIAQAERTAEKLRNKNFDLIYCSPLLRAKETCEIINKYHKLCVIYDDRLMERNYGVFHGKPYSSLNNECIWDYKKSDTSGNLESLNDFCNRIYTFIHQIQEDDKEKNVLIVCHSGVAKMFYCFFNGIPHDGNLLKLRIQNGEFLEYQQ